MQLQGREAGTLTALKGVAQWQVYCFRSGAMSNCQSTGNVTQTQSVGSGKAGTSNAANATVAALTVSREQLPAAIRCRLTLGEGSGFAGTLTRDLLLAPQPNQN